MKILLTNDDGYYAPGLLALKKAVAQVGEVLVVAPSRNFSASGHVKTMHKPLRISAVQLADGTPAYTTSGAPSDCVALVKLGALDFKPDVVISGINPNANLGHDVTYSGTVTAALEGAISGIPSMAVSVESADAYDTAAHFVAQLALKLIENKLPSNIVLNVNVPRPPIKDVQITRMGRRVYRDELVVRNDPRGQPYYWIGGEAPSGIADEGTDIWALENGCISITPLQLDFTHHGWIEPLRQWGLNLAI